MTAERAAIKPNPMFHSEWLRDPRHPSARARARDLDDHHVLHHLAEALPVALGAADLDREHDVLQVDAAVRRGEVGLVLKSTPWFGSRRYGLEVDAKVLAVDAIVLKATPRFGSRRHGLEVDVTVWKSTLWFGSRRHGLEVDATVLESPHCLEVDAVASAVDDAILSGSIVVD